MTSDTTARSAVAILAIATLLVAPAPALAAEDSPATGGGVVAPSTYVEDIENSAKSGGIAGEPNAAAAQAEAGEAPPPAPAAQPEQNAAAIGIDLIIARPTALMATVAGAALSALSAPVTVPSGTYDAALEQFVVEPGNHLIAPLGR